MVPIVPVFAVVLLLLLTSRIAIEDREPRCTFLPFRGLSILSKPSTSCNSLFFVFAGRFCGMHMPHGVDMDLDSEVLH